MAKAKATKQTGASTQETPAGNGQEEEKLTNKAEAIRRALSKLGTKAKPAKIQDFIKAHFDIEMTTKVISVYKSKLVKKRGEKGTPGRKSKEVGAIGEPAPKRASHEAVSLRDLRIVKEIGDRLGPARMRELIELMVD